MLLFVSLPGLWFPSPFLRNTPFLMSKSIWTEHHSDLSWDADSNVFLKLKYSFLLQLDGRMEHVGPGRGWKISVLIISGRVYCWGWLSLGNPLWPVSPSWWSLLSVGALAAALGHQQLVKLDRDTRHAPQCPLWRECLSQGSGRQGTSVSYREKLQQGGTEGFGANKAKRKCSNTVHPPIISQLELHPLRD